MIRSLAHALAYLSVLYCCAFVAPPNRAAAQDWTRFRGPNGQGQSDATTIPDQWTNKDYNWKVTLPGVGQSSPVIWGDKIFLTSADADATLHIFCLSTKDGKQLWDKKYPSSTYHIHQNNSFASSTPALDKDNVYVAWATTKEYSLAALTHDGKEVWKRDLGPFESSHGFGTSPMVYEDTVYITDDQDGPKSFLWAINDKDGQTKWQIPREKAKGAQNCSYSTPTIYQPEKGPAELIVNSWAQGITSVDMPTGKTNWEARVFPLRPIGCPVLAGGLIWGNCGEGSGNNSVFAVRPGDKSGKQPEVVHKYDKSTAPYVTSLIAYKNWVFFWGDKGLATCIEADSGKKIWNERVSGPAAGSPIRVMDRLYCITEDGDVVVLAAADKFQKISTVSLGEHSRSTPAVSDGVMYLRTESQLFSLGEEVSSVVTLHTRC